MWNILKVRRFRYQRVLSPNTKIYARIKLYQLLFTCEEQYFILRLYENSLGAPKWKGDPRNECMVPGNSMLIFLRCDDEIIFIQMFFIFFSNSRNLSVVYFVQLHYKIIKSEKVQIFYIICFNINCIFKACQTHMIS